MPNRIKQIDGLEDLDYLREAAKYFHHKARSTAMGWRLFEPSYFIYAYFAFNSFYSVDWRNTIKEEQLLSYDYRDEATKASKMIQDLVGFISKSFNNDKYLLLSEFDLYVRNAWAFLQTEIAENDGNSSRQSLEEAIEELEGIRLFGCLNEEEDKLRFREAINRLLVEPRTSRDFARDLTITLKTINGVRNNIFHGEKSVVYMMNDEKQRRRLMFYTTILLATNDLLFEAIDRA